MGAGVGLAVVPVVAGPAGATTTYTVTDADDDAAGVASNCTTPVPDACTLRDALAAATSAGTDVTITLPSLDVGDIYNVENTNGELVVGGGNTVTIDGGGQSNTIIEATCDTGID